MRQLLLGLVGWATAVVIATAVGFGAISLVGGDAGGSITSIDFVSEPSPTAASTTAQHPRRRSSSGPVVTRGSSTSSPARSAATQVTPAGSVTASCRASGARLISWTPSTGWSVGSFIDEGETRQVVFADADGAVVTVDVACDDEGPVFSVSETRPTASEDPEPSPSETVSVPSGENAP